GGRGQRHVPRDLLVRRRRCAAGGHVRPHPDRLRQARRRAGGPARGAARRPGHTGGLRGARWQGGAGAGQDRLHRRRLDRNPRWPGARRRGGDRGQGGAARRQRGAGDRRAGRQGQGRGPQRRGSGRQGRQAVSRGQGDRDAGGPPSRGHGMGAGLVGVATRRRVTVAMFWITMLLFGSIALASLKVNLLPDLSYPTLTVRTEYTGAAPSEIETLITEPVEE